MDLSRGSDKVGSEKEGKKSWQGTSKRKNKKESHREQAELHTFKTIKLHPG